MNKNNNILYPFSKQLMFAKVMEDRELCRDMLGIIFPDRKVKDIIVHKGIHVCLFPPGVGFRIIVKGIETLFKR